jgi:hypothetical protein
MPESFEGRLYRPAWDNLLAMPDDNSVFPNNQRWLFGQTLILCTGEFGRTPGSRDGPKRGWS